MTGSDELIEKNEKREKLDRKGEVYLAISSYERHPEEEIVYELRDLLTFIKSYKQMIDINHPEAREFDYWQQIDVNVEAMVSRLMEYERRLHTA